MTQLIRTSPGLLVTILLMVICAVVCMLSAFLMKRMGASLRPVYWFVGFFALVVLPQFLAHLYTALTATSTEAPRVAALQNIANAATPEARSADVKQLFGLDADAQLVVDVRKSIGDAFANAEFAQFASLPNGDTVLLARFKSYSAAEKAWVSYLRMSGLNQLGGKGDSQRGYAVSRPVGDRAYALHMNNMVGVWTGKDDDAIRKRMLAGGFETPRSAPLAEGTASSPDAQAGPKPTEGTKVAAAGAASFRIPLIAGALAAYLFLVVLYFFKGAAWAGTSSAKPGIAPVPGPELATRLEAINTVDAPFRVERGTKPNEFIATWRYADAKWVDIARARGMRRTFRIRLTLDDQSRVVRATDYEGSYDWSAGGGGANIEWKAQLGIVMFQYEHKRVFGLQLDEQGRVKPELSYSYTFNLNEMKSPLIETVTQAGWTWRPTVWQGPTWLRWLTE